MYERDYVYTKRMDGHSVAEVTARVRQALAAAGFGVLTEIDVQETLKKKLGVERKPYLILGACNPPLAHRALQAEPPIGVFLPCNVDIFEGDDGDVYVQTPKPTMMFGLVGNPDVRPIAEEVDAKLRQVLDHLVPPVRSAAMFRPPRHPVGEARRGRILDVCNRGATKPGGMHRRPKHGWNSDGRN